MCQKSRQKDKMRIIEMLNEYKTKEQITFFSKIEEQIGGEGK